MRQRESEICTKEADDGEQGRLYICLLLVEWGAWKIPEGWFRIIPLTQAKGS